MSGFAELRRRATSRKLLNKLSSEPKNNQKKENEKKDKNEEETKNQT